MEEDEQSMDEAAPRPQHQWRPRVSLLAALLLMTIVGLAIVMVQLWRASDAQRREIFQLRSELGYLTINDKDMIMRSRST
jgi:hypothetical protein